MACSIQYPHSSEEADAMPKIGANLRNFTALPPPKGLKGPSFSLARKRRVGRFYIYKPSSRAIEGKSPKRSGVWGRQVMVAVHAPEYSMPKIFIR